MACEAPVALGIARGTAGAVAIEIDASWHAGVRGQGEEIREGRIEARVERGEGLKAGVIVDAEEQEDIRLGGVQDGAGGNDFWGVAADVAEEEAGGFAGEAGGPYGDAEGIGRCGPGEKRESREKRDYIEVTGTTPSSVSARA